MRDMEISSERNSMRVLFWDPSQKVDAVASAQKKGGTL